MFNQIGKKKLMLPVKQIQVSPQQILVQQLWHQAQLQSSSEKYLSAEDSFQVSNMFCKNPLIRQLP